MSLHADTSVSSKKNRAVILLLLLIEALYVALALNYLPFTVDDPFITCRYAANLAGGDGLVYNPGERVEGISNFLFTVMVAGVLKCGGDALLGAKLLGILFGAGVLLVVFAFSRSINGVGTLRSLIAPLIVVVNVPFLAWSAGGLETTLYMFLLTTGVYLLHGEIDKGRFPWSAAAFGLLAVTRPEGFFFAGALMVGAYLLGKRQPARYTVAWVALFAAVVVPFECWRLWYFGRWLPNTVYAKVNGISAVSVVQTIWGYCLGYLNVSGGVTLYLAGLIPLLACAGRTTFLRLCLAAVVLQSTYVIAVNGDWMPAYRFFVPIAGVAAILLSQGLIVLYRDVATKVVRLPVAVASLAVILIALFATGHQELKANFPGFYSWYKNRTYEALVDNVASNRNYMLMARWITMHIPDKKRTLAIGEAGYIPYATELPTIDLYGLTNPEVLVLPGVHSDRMGADLLSPRNTGVLQRYLSEKKADYLLLARFGNEPGAGNDSLLWNGRYALLHRSGNLLLYRRTSSMPQGSPGQ